MNYWHIEFMAKDRHQQILEEAEHIHLERIALQSRANGSPFFKRTMFNFANWMISTGKQLRKRYEIPAVNCNNSPRKSFVH